MRAKRSLGQNFLQNVGIAEKITNLAHPAPGDHILEIGPGKGILTKILARSAAHVTAVEKDDSLFEKLTEVFAGQQGVTLIHGDILECDLSVLIRKGTKIVANLPYNIASQLIIRLTDYADQLSLVVVMVQKEVAERICARTGQKEYSGLSVLVSSVFEAVPGFIVSPNNFIPAPKVTSQVIKLLPRQTAAAQASRPVFKKVVFQAFAHRRKMLKNSLLGLVHMDKDLLNDIAGDAQIDLSRRPQDLSSDDYHRLSISYGNRVSFKA
jgi:16S rRNA (adenine1518-N6/adenine1519-N6)-dimethyltransferase